MKVALGVFGVVAAFVLLFILGTAITAGFVALAWNVLADAAFGVNTLSFIQVIAVAVIINIIHSIFSR